MISCPPKRSTRAMSPGSLLGALVVITSTFFTRAAHAESFAFTREGVELPVQLERVVVVHGGGATVATVSVLAAASTPPRGDSDIVSIVELPDGTVLESLARVASPFSAVDGLCEARVVLAREIDPCDLHTKASTGPAQTCAGVRGSSNAAAKPIAVWDAPFRERPRGGPVTVLTGRELDSGASALGVTVSRRASSYAKAHPRAAFVLTSASAFTFRGAASMFVWPSRTAPNEGGATWVEVTALDREQNTPRLQSLRRARVAGVVQKRAAMADGDRGIVRLALAREVLSRTGADIVEEVVAPHACLLDATSRGLAALGFAELPAGRAPVGFDPAMIPEPEIVEHPCPKRAPRHIKLSGPCVPHTSVVPPDPKLAEVPTFWPSVARWLGPSGHAFELDFAGRPHAVAPTLPAYELREPWTGPIRCKNPAPGRYTRTFLDRVRRDPSESLMSYSPAADPLACPGPSRGSPSCFFESAFEPQLALTVFAAERGPLLPPSASTPDDPSAVAPKSPVEKPAPPPLRRPAGCSCDLARDADLGAVEAVLLAFTAALSFALRRAKRLNGEPSGLAARTEVIPPA